MEKIERLDRRKEVSFMIMNTSYLDFPGESYKFVALEATNS